MDEFLLEALTNFGAPALVLGLILSSLGLPIPATLPVVAAGALARQGILDPRAVLVAALLGAVAGDCACFLLGRGGGQWMRRRVRRFSEENWQQAQRRFERHGALTVYTTRWLFNYLDVLVSLVAGGSGYPFRLFFIYVLAGRATWAMLYGGLGYAFADRWQEIVQLTGRYGPWLALLALIGAVLYFLYRRRNKEKAIPTALD